MMTCSKTFSPKSWVIFNISDGNHPLLTSFLRLAAYPHRYRTYTWLLTYRTLNGSSNKTNAFTSIVTLWILSFLGGGGVLRFGLDGGVPLEPQNPYPSLRVIFLPIVKDFSWKIGPFLQIWAQSENWTHVLGFFCKKRDSCFKISCKKATH